ncbi:MAG: methyltransferase domain-containing protein [Candidatus Shapirobacteria bacterium]
MNNKANKRTSWDNVANWYDSEVGDRGHYYHQKVILPNIIRLANINEKCRVLDIGCGQGILGKQIDSNIEYVGIDISPKLVEIARQSDSLKNHTYIVGDATKNIEINGKFERIFFILSLQNMAQPYLVIKNAVEKLSDDGKLLVVLNHPCFRIPQNSDWGFDTKLQRQYRKIFRYYQPLKAEIKASPFKQTSELSTWSFHYPLSTYSEMMFDNGLSISKIEEWVSPKTSIGGRAVAENIARAEIPLFLTIVAQKARGVL